MPPLGYIQSRAFFFNPEERGGGGGGWETPPGGWGQEWLPPLEAQVWSFLNPKLCKQNCFNQNLENQIWIMLSSLFQNQQARSSARLPGRWPSPKTA